jgi:hypothetical protein
MKTHPVWFGVESFHIKVGLRPLVVILRCFRLFCPCLIATSDWTGCRPYIKAFRTNKVSISIDSVTMAIRLEWFSYVLGLVVLYFEDFLNRF